MALNLLTSSPMKTLTLLAACVLGLSAVSAANAQSDTTTTPRTRITRQTVSTRNNAALTARLRRIEAQSRQNIQATAPRSNIDGSVTRAARSGNPLQMINPLAPAEYGDGSDVTRRDPEDPYQRPQGLRLFVVNF